MATSQTNGIEEGRLSIRTTNLNVSSLKLEPEPSPSAQDTTPFALADDDDSIFEEEKLIMLPLTGLSGGALLYVQTSNYSRRFINTRLFDWIVILAIAWASLAVGIQTYPSLSENKTINVLDAIALIIFIIEASVKIHAEGLCPWYYFTGKEWRWNNFDFAIILMSLPIWGSAIGHNVMILRLFRLLRILKIMKQIPELYMIIMGLAAGLQSIGYILLLLFLVYYMYSIAGVMAWRYTDPFHFRGVPIAMVTLFRVSTLDNWMNVMTVNYLGCDRFHGDVYSDDPSRAIGFQYCNTTAIFGAEMSSLSSDEIDNQRLIRSILASIYFMTFVLVSALVMLSLFIGAVTMGMDQSMEEMRALKKKNEEKKRRLRQAQRENKRNLRRSLGSINNDETPDPSQFLSDLKKSDLKRLRFVLLQVWDDLEGLGSHEKEGHPWKMKYLKFADKAARFAMNKYFQSMVTLAILVAGVTVGLQTAEEIDQEIGDTLNIIDYIVLGIFTFEVIVKLVAEGLQPWHYFYTPWNVFDFVIVAGSFLPGSGGMLTVLRLLRIIRVIKLVRVLPQLQVIVNALIHGFKSIGYISLIVILCFYVFGILGNILFRDNDPFHFGQLHFTMMTLLRCATTESWSEVLFINYYGCKVYGGLPYARLPNKCDPVPKGWIAVAYFCSFVVIGGMVLLSLFVGLVTTSMDTATVEQEKYVQVMVECEKLQNLYGVELSEVITYMEVFEILDRDNSKSVESKELAMGLAAVGIYPSEAKLESMMAAVDTDGSGEIGVVEFVEFMILQKTQR